MARGPVRVRSSRAVESNTDCVLAGATKSCHMGWCHLSRIDIYCSLSGNMHRNWTFLSWKNSWKLIYYLGMMKPRLWNCLPTVQRLNYSNSEWEYSFLVSRTILKSLLGGLTTKRKASLSWTRHRQGSTNRRNPSRTRFCEEPNRRVDKAFARIGKRALWATGRSYPRNSKLRFYINYILIIRVGVSVYITETEDRQCGTARTFWSVTRVFRTQFYQRSLLIEAKRLQSFCDEISFRYSVILLIIFREEERSRLNFVTNYRE